MPEAQAGAAAPDSVIIRHHADARRASSAVYSSCERYRYLLTREWDAAAPRVLFVMLNPSKATEAHNDPTIERCERRARALGFGAVRIANIFAWRETDPRHLKAAADPIGPDNDRLIHDSVQNWLRGADDMAICAWGVHGVHRARGAIIAAQLHAAGRPLMVLGVTQDGHPAHPLYIAYARQPFAWITGAADGAR